MMKRWWRHVQPVLRCFAYNSCPEIKIMITRYEMCSDLAKKTCPFFGQLKPNSIMLSSARLAGRRLLRAQIPLRCPARYQVADQFATKFHYTIQLATSSRAGSRAAGHVVCVSQANYTVQLASRSQTSSRPNPITLSSLRPARELVASWTA